VKELYVLRTRNLNAPGKWTFRSQTQINQKWAKVVLRRNRISIAPLSLSEHEPTIPITIETTLLAGSTDTTTEPKIPITIETTLLAGSTDTTTRHMILVLVLLQHLLVLSSTASTTQNLVRNPSIEHFDAKTLKPTWWQPFISDYIMTSERPDAEPPQQHR
jgi:hypothetical protein